MRVRVRCVLERTITRGRLVMDSIENRASDRRERPGGHGNASAHLDDLTDRLIEKRERFQYFIVAAATAVLVFTFNDYDEKGGILRLGPRGLVVASWACLLASAGAALFQIALRHDRYWRFFRSCRLGLASRVIRAKSGGSSGRAGASFYCSGPWESSSLLEWGSYYHGRLRNLEVRCVA
jgi:hypothetical protein